MTRATKIRFFDFSYPKTVMTYDIQKDLKIFRILCRLGMTGTMTEKTNDTLLFKYFDLSNNISMKQCRLWSWWCTILRRLPLGVVHDQIKWRNFSRSRRQLIAKDVDKVETKTSDSGLKIFITSDVQGCKRIASYGR